MAVHQAPGATPATTAAGVAAEPETMPNGEAVMHVKVYSPFQTYFDEPAYSISASNQTGPFDILPRHHNFITLVDACELIIRAPQGERRIKISGAVMHVKADHVSVFLDV